MSTDRTADAPARRRRPGRLAVALLVVASFVVLPLRSASAAGLWGAGGYPYRAGLVCHSGPLSSPLVSWDVGGGPGYLVAPLNSDGVQDSGAPPLASVGTQQRLDVPPGTDGFTSDADIAAYAALLTGVGSTGNDQQVAAVARLVMEHAGASDVPGCATSGQTLLQQAAAGAGPYTVTVAPPSRPAIMGAPATVVATVRGGQGQPVAGLAVGFTAIGGSLSSTTVITDANGRAGTLLTIPVGGGAVSAAVTATVHGVVGLQEVSVVAASSATDPTGASVAAIVPAAPTEVTATATVPVDQTASPVLAAGGTAPAVAIGATLRPTASVSGMRGHSGLLSFTIYGPASAQAARGCAGVRLSSSSPIAATTNAVPVTGDRSVTASTWTPTEAGCYAVQASLQTTDATPAVTATSSLTAAASSVTVLAVTARLSVAHGLVGRGAQAATLSTAQTDGAAGTVSARLLGPLTPGGDGDCAGRDWSRAPTAATVSATSHGDGATALTSAAVAAPGCYAWTATLDLAYGDGRVPVPAAPATLLLVTPTVSLTSDQLWSVSPRPVGTHVSVTGTYGQPGHVSVHMAYVPSPLVGCQVVRWSQAQQVSTGPTVAVRGPDAVAVPSGPTPKLGCYQPIPYLTMDANPAIRVSGADDVTSNAVIAGLAVDTGTPIGGRAGGGGFGVALWIVVGLLAAVEVAAIAGTAVAARRDEPQETILPLSGLD